MPDERIPVRLYGQDFDTWAISQAAKLRAIDEAVSGGEDQPPRPASS